MPAAPEFRLPFSSLFSPSGTETSVHEVCRRTSRSMCTRHEWSVAGNLSYRAGVAVDTQTHAPRRTAGWCAWRIENTSKRTKQGWAAPPSSVEHPPGVRQNLVTGSGDQWHGHYEPNRLSLARMARRPLHFVIPARAGMTSTQVSTIRHRPDSSATCPPLRGIQPPSLEPREGGCFKSLDPIRSRRFEAVPENDIRRQWGVDGGAVVGTDRITVWRGHVDGRRTGQQFARAYS
jgi:hypothetical protein